jgi:hypothetical protein
LNLADTIFVSSLVFSKISEGGGLNASGNLEGGGLKWVKCFVNFLREEG